MLSLIAACQRLFYGYQTFFSHRHRAAARPCKANPKPDKLSQKDGHTMRATLATLAAVLLVGLLVIWSWFAFSGRQEMVFHGFVQGELVFVGTEETGRLAELLATAGQEVKSDQLLFVLDSSLETAACNEAAASLSEARARLASALAARERPEEVEILKAKERRAEAALQLSQREFDRAREPQNAARRDLQDRTLAQRDMDLAALDEIRRQIALAGMSARREDIEAARATVAALEARLAAAQNRLDRRKVKAPFGGIIQQVYFQSGEIVLPGRPVASLLPAKNIIVRFFAGEALLPVLAVGDAVAVSCDGCAASLNARIRFISPTVEYTPPIIYSNEDRNRLVFMVEAVPEEPQKLRPGQPVTVSLPPPASESRLR
jgi:HlyD family secretion protein